MSKGPDASQSPKTNEKQLPADATTDAHNTNVERSRTEEYEQANRTANDEFDEMDFTISNHGISGDKEKTQSSMLNKAGVWSLRGIGQVFNVAGKILRQPLTEKTGTIISTVIGLGLASAIIASAVMTGGATLPLVIEVVAAVAGSFAPASANAGYFGMRPPGGLFLLTAITGVSFGPSGIGIGLGAGVAIDKACEKTLGISLSEAAAKGAEFIGGLANNAADNLEKRGVKAEKNFEAQRTFNTSHGVARPTTELTPAKKVEEVSKVQTMPVAREANSQSFESSKTGVEVKAPVKIEGNKKDLTKKLKDKMLGKHTKEVIIKKNQGPSSGQGPQVS